MLSLPPSTRIFLCMTIADMRRGFDGLSAMVSTELDDDPLSGHLFVFRNRRADRLKILYRDPPRRSCRTNGPNDAGAFRAPCPRYAP